MNTSRNPRWWSWRSRNPAISIHILPSASGGFLSAKTRFSSEMCWYLPKDWGHPYPHNLLKCVETVEDIRKWIRLRQVSASLDLCTALKDRCVGGLSLVKPDFGESEPDNKNTDLCVALDVKRTTSESALSTRIPGQWSGGLCFFYSLRSNLLANIALSFAKPGSGRWSQRSPPCAWDDRWDQRGGGRR